MFTLLCVTNCNDKAVLIAAYDVKWNHNHNAIKMCALGIFTELKVKEDMVTTSSRHCVPFLQFFLPLTRDSSFQMISHAFPYFYFISFFFTLLYIFVSLWVWNIYIWILTKFTINIYIYICWREQISHSI